MNDNKTEVKSNGIELEYQLDEPIEKVWRALSIPEFRESWLPHDALANPDATTLRPGEELSYRMRDNTPPFLESRVTFKIAPNGSGGTSLRIIHELDLARFDRTVEAANNNSQILMLAA